MNASNFSKMSPRLLSAAGFVRQGATVADVGSDHAYLPIYLCMQGKIRSAVASDINEGPVARASINVASAHLGKKIKVVRADGLSGIEEYSPGDIVICGMGGELIASIIGAAEWTKSPKIRLIMQPMTHADKLRKFLLDNGYSIVGEALAKEDKIYQIICAEYRGSTESYSECELILGKLNILAASEELFEYAAYVRSVFETRLRGKRSAGADVSEEERIIAELDKILEKDGSKNEGT